MGKQGSYSATDGARSARSFEETCATLASREALFDRPLNLIATDLETALRLAD